MKKKINLVWDSWSKTNKPMPNGLHHKYRAEWETKYKNEYHTNVLSLYSTPHSFNSTGKKPS